MAPLRCRRCAASVVWVMAARRRVPVRRARLLAGERRGGGGAFAHRFLGRLAQWRLVAAAASGRGGTGGRERRGREWRAADEDLFFGLDGRTWTSPSKDGPSTWQ